MTDIHALGPNTTLTRAEYDELVCCGQPARVAHATDTLPVAGAVCGTCLCAVTSVRYGAVSVRPCITHAS
ncbi:hypothetical protein [Kitasatospora cathayae]|uniref:Uncharacterized protein n=1 Tax=Kitasatospora cathayae TaxID=3004092 RepID=A0ABY7Q9V0_9ACTN|nr:hypothetical protein [Kitasatospora sp. HUAS 3-15]WBP89520.1 hypothetical protein O1G21_29215 [Kitasatospora sp. HUAS 3-15]